MRSAWQWAVSFFRRTPRKKDNYPFTPLIQRIETDCNASAQLSMYSDKLVTVAKERIGREETEMRERLATMGGNPSAVLLVGLGTGIWSTWQSMVQHYTVVSLVILGLLLLGTFFSAYTFHLRMALLELARCRGMLELALAERTFSEGSDRRS